MGKRNPTRCEKNPDTQKLKNFPNCLVGDTFRLLYLSQKNRIIPKYSINQSIYFPMAN